MDVLSHRFPAEIQGEFIELSKIEPEHAEMIFKWRSSDAARHLNQPDGYSLEMQKEWIKQRSDTEINYLILDRLTSLSVGMIGIYDCDWHNGVCNVGRLLLDPKYINKGTPYGLEALKIGYGYAFDVMGFRKISGTINTKNDKIYKLQLYLGMVQEGLFKAHVMQNGEPQDIYFLSLFREDFVNYKAKIDEILNRFR